MNSINTPDNRHELTLDIFADPGNSWIQLSSDDVDLIAERLGVASAIVLLDVCEGEAHHPFDARMRPGKVYFDEMSGQYARVAKICHDAGFSIDYRTIEHPVSPVRNFLPFEVDGFIAGLNDRLIEVEGHPTPFQIRGVSEVVEAEVISASGKPVMQPVSGYALEVVYRDRLAIISCENQGHLVNLIPLHPDLSPTQQAVNHLQTEAASPREQRDSPDTGPSMEP